MLENKTEKLSCLKPVKVIVFLVQPCGQKLKLAANFAEPALPEFDVAALSQLEAMGFPLIRCQKALLATGNSDAEAAMNWLFQHMEDPGKNCLSRDVRYCAECLFRH